MKKAIVVVLALAAVLVPAALATAPAQDPADYCKAHPELIGQGKLYKNMGQCVAKQTAQSDQNTVNAAKTCKAQKSDANFAANHGGKTFAQFYGTNGDKGNGKGAANGKGNAFGKCVSGMASGKTAQQQTAQVNAAKKCRTAPLKDQIGTAPKTYRNFGACVAAQTKTS